jgi:integral membrane sensor domain MASE1
VAIAYFLAARLSLALLEKSDGVAVFWPAAGVASGALIVAGSAARWPVIVGVMVATFLANLLGDLWSKGEPNWPAANRDIIGRAILARSARTAADDWPPRRTIRFD